MMRKGGRYVPYSDYYWGMSHGLVMQGIYLDPHEGSIQSFQSARLFNLSQPRHFSICLSKLQPQAFVIVIFYETLCLVSLCFLCS